MLNNCAFIKFFISEKNNFIIRMLRTIHCCFPVGCIAIIRIVPQNHIALAIFSLPEDFIFRFTVDDKAKLLFSETETSLPANRRNSSISKFTLLSDIPINSAMPTTQGGRGCVKMAFICLPILITPRQSQPAASTCRRSSPSK